MRARGWATAGVMMACGLMSSSTLAVWLELAHDQRQWAQRQWLWQAQVAAEAVLRDAQQTWQASGQGSGPGGPATDCLRGRCVWQGHAGLARAHWQARLDQAAWGGCGDPAAWPSAWPTLPQTRLACWSESTPHPAGTLVRFTVWVQGDRDGQSTLMQAVWQASGGAGQWLSWREVLP